MTQHEKGKCWRCGSPIPDRFWNPYYCWSCQRIRRNRIGLGIAAVVAFIFIMGFTQSFWATIIFGAIEGLVVWAIIKNDTTI